MAIYLLRSVIGSLLGPQLLGHSPPHGRPQKTPATARRGRAGRVSGGLFPVVPVLSLHLPGPRSAGGKPGSAHAGCVPRSQHPQCSGKCTARRRPLAGVW